MWDSHVAQLPYIPSEVLAAQDSQQQSGTVLIKNGTEVFPGCQETNLEGFYFLVNSRCCLSPFTLPPCEHISTFYRSGMYQTAVIKL